MTYKASECVEFFGEEFIAHFEYNYTEGYSAGYWEPGCDDEVDIVNIWLQRKTQGNAPKFKLTHEAFWAVKNQEWANITCAYDYRDRTECCDTY